MKTIKPLPHGVIDYAWAGAMIAAPWLFGFHRNKKATGHAVVSGVAVIGLSLLTRYPLGAVKLVPFPVHGVIETLAGLNTIAAPWTMKFSRNRAAKWTHLVGGLGTLAVVSMTDYQAAERSVADRDLGPSLRSALGTTADDEETTSEASSGERRPAVT